MDARSTQPPRRTGTSTEAVVALPWRAALVAATVAATVVGLVSMVTIGVLGDGSDLAAGPAGAGLVLALSAGSLLATVPWRPRPISTWTTLWLAGIVGRLLVTPAAAFLLYSATPLALSPLMLSVAATYIVVQLVEAAALAAHLKPPPSGWAANRET